MANSQDCSRPMVCNCEEWFCNAFWMRRGVSIEPCHFQSRWRCTFLLSLIIGIPTIIIALIPISLWSTITLGLTWKDFILALLATIVQIFGGYQFYISAFKSVRHCSANMDVLIALATTIAYVYSVST